MLGPIRSILCLSLVLMIAGTAAASSRAAEMGCWFFGGLIAGACGLVMLALTVLVADRRSVDEVEEAAYERGREDERRIAFARRRNVVPMHRAASD